MQEDFKSVESLLEEAGEYGKTSFELLKLKALDKTTDFVSTIVTKSIVIVFFGAFLLFLNLGLAFWLGEILGRFMYGFLLLAAFYGIITFLFHVFFHKGLKKLFGNLFIKQIIK